MIVPIIEVRAIRAKSTTASIIDEKKFQILSVSVWFLFSSTRVSLNFESYIIKFFVLNKQGLAGSEFTS